MILQINTEAENAFVVAMAEEALAIDGNIGRDYWMGGVKTGDGTWIWQSGDPMDYTNWCEACPDTEGWDYSQLLKDGYPGRLDTYYWARNDLGGADDGVICEINLDKQIDKPDCPDKGADISQLLKNGYPGTLDTYYWARSDAADPDNGVICEINVDKQLLIIHCNMHEKDIWQETNQQKSRFVTRESPKEI